MDSTGVRTGLGLTVLIFPNPSPRRPSPAPFVNWALSLLASSIDYPSTHNPPNVTLSVPTVPEAVDPSPYLIFQVEPDVLV
jgi:hypothetical protein